MTLSLSLVHVHWILCYRIKKDMVSEAKDLCVYIVNVAIQTGALPSKVRVVGSIPLRGTGSFFLLSFPSTSFLAFLTLRVYPGV